MKVAQAEPSSPAAVAGARSLALVGYGLVIASFFTAWLTGLAAWAVAFFNRKDPDPLARSHFRNQLRITDIFGLMSAGGIGLALWGGWTAFAPLFHGAPMEWGRLWSAGAWVLLGLAVWGVGTLIAIISAAVGIVRLLKGELARPASGR